jgi:hypothetical protein
LLPAVEVRVGLMALLVVALADFFTMGQPLYQQATIK